MVSCAPASGLPMGHTESCIVAQQQLARHVKKPLFLVPDSRVLWSMHCPKKGAETARCSGSWQVTATLEKAPHEVVGISSGRNGRIVRACAQERGSYQGTHDPSTLLILLYLCSYFSKCLCSGPPHRMYSNLCFSSENEVPTASVDKEGAHLVFPKCLFHLRESCVLCVYKRLASFHFLAIDDLL